MLFLEHVLFIRSLSSNELLFWQI